MKKWGKSRNLIVARKDINVDEAAKLLAEFELGKVKVTITACTEEPGSWDKMIEVNKTTSYTLDASSDLYELNFKERKYLKNGEPFYMTDTEARAAYFCLTSDVIVDNYSDAAMNMRRRTGGKKSLLSELLEDNVTVVKKE